MENNTISTARGETAVVFLYIDENGEYVFLPASIGSGRENDEHNEDAYLPALFPLYMDPSSEFEKLKTVIDIMLYKCNHFAPYIEEKHGGVPLENHLFSAQAGRSVICGKKKYVLCVNGTRGTYIDRFKAGRGFVRDKTVRLPEKSGAEEFANAIMKMQGGAENKREAVSNAFEKN
ncbi:MAG: hypothetical protein Q4C12_02325 [Clostridia bacterium]|nr:hypothetical protein [Clostridia bacterium]